MTGQRVNTECFRHSAGILSASFSHDGKRLVTGSWTKRPECGI